jgi:hypothetical protein
MKVMTSKEIRDVLKAKWSKLKYVWLFDTRYCAVPESKFLGFANGIGPLREFNAQSFDCDDFSLLTHAYVKLIASKELQFSIAFGEITTKYTNTNEIHNLNILITEGNRVLLYEPQQKQFVTDEFVKPFFVRI